MTIKTNPRHEDEINFELELEKLTAYIIQSFNLYISRNSDGTMNPYQSIFEIKKLLQARFG